MNGYVNLIVDMWDSPDDWQSLIQEHIVCRGLETQKIADQLRLLNCSGDIDAALEKYSWLRRAS
jgi:hypothetical protein